MFSIVFYTPLFILATLLTTKHTFAKNGILEHSVLLQIWREPSYPKSIHSILLNILENFEVTFPLDSFDDRYGGKNILPSLLPATVPEEFFKKWPRILPPDVSEIGKNYKFDFIPFGLFGRIIVRLLRLGSAELYWRYGILLRQGSKLTLVRLVPEDNSIEVRVRSSVKPTIIGRELTESIESLVRHWYKIDMKIEVPCTHCLEADLTPPYSFPLELCESLAIQGKPFINCERDQLITAVRLDQIVPDLTLKEYEGVKISFEELEIGGLLGGTHLLFFFLKVNKRNSFFFFFFLKIEGSAAKVYKGKWRNEIVAIKQLNLNNEQSDDQDSFSQKFKEFRREVLIMRFVCFLNNNFSVEKKKF